MTGILGTLHWLTDDNNVYKAGISNEKVLSRFTEKAEYAFNKAVMFVEAKRNRRDKQQLDRLHA